MIYLKNACNILTILVLFFIVYIQTVHKGNYKPIFQKTLRALVYIFIAIYVIGHMYLAFTGKLAGNIDWGFETQSLTLIIGIVVITVYNKYKNKK